LKKTFVTMVINFYYEIIYVSDVNNKKVIRSISTIVLNKKNLNFINFDLLQSFKNFNCDTK